METPSPRAVDKESDNIYLKIWEIEQNHTNTRWTVATFFLSVSFAIFGISLQIEKPLIPRVVPQFLAVVIYWFAYLLFRQFNAFTLFLRKYLQDMETARNTSLTLESAAKDFMSTYKALSATRLLFLFGVMYTIAAVVLAVIYP